MDTQTIKDRLAAISREILAIYELINESEPSLPPEAQERFDSGICLECENPFDEGETAKRGLHEKCHRRVLRAIQAGKYTELQAIKQGRLAPKGQGGRPPQLTQLEKLSAKKAKPRKK